MLTLRQRQDVSFKFRYGIFLCLQCLHGDIAVRVDVGGGGEVDAGQFLVRLELQADYLTVVCANHVQCIKQVLDRSEIDEALNAANAIGDDRLQRQAQDTVVSNSFTHGASAQRLRWFKAVFDTGDFRGADQLFKLPYDRL